MKWEYKVITNQYATEMTNKEVIEKMGEFRLNSRLTIDKLNQFGEDGWELVSYHAEFDFARAVAIFKRPKNQG